MPAKSHHPEPEVTDGVEETTDCADCQAYQEKWQRALADLENLRKRSEQERLHALRYGQENLLRELLPVVDNFSRATSFVPEEQKASAWVTGIAYIQKNLLDVLAAEGVKPVEVTVGDPFDAATQEAIGTVLNAELAEDSVAEVKQPGYWLQERLLRPAQVIVSKTN